VLIIFSHRLASWLAQGNEHKPSRRWHTLPLPIGILIVAVVLTPLLCTIFASAAPRASSSRCQKPS
jgi:hypothetical protein